jgi:hypothetical protein
MFTPKSPKRQYAVSSIRVVSLVDVPIKRAVSVLTHFERTLNQLRQTKLLLAYRPHLAEELTRN